MSNHSAEKNLIEGIRAGSEETLNRLYRDNFPKVMKLGIRNNLSGSDIQDIYHESIIVLIENIRFGKFKADSKVETYLIGIVKYKLLEKFRRNQKTSTLELIDNIEIPILIEEENVDHRVLELAKRLKEISSECEQLLVSYYYENKNLKEIARDLNYTDAFIRVKKLRCMNQLRASINRKE